jgi:hypothetical protein
VDAGAEGDSEGEQAEALVGEGHLFGSFQALVVDKPMTPLPRQRLLGATWESTENRRAGGRLLPSVGGAV